MRITTVVSYLKESVKLYPVKVAFCDPDAEITFCELENKAKKIAMPLMEAHFFKCPIAVYLPKGVGCVPAYLGCLYSGNFYSPVDVEMPLARIRKIIDTLKPKAVITDSIHLEDAKMFSEGAEIVLVDEITNVVVDEVKIQNVLDRVSDTDIMYVLFTSGSTGNPKGVVVSHRALVDFVEWAVSKYHFDETTVFGNQTPFYFSMSIWDLFIPLKCGGSCHIIPHELFMFASQLMKYVKENAINTLVWVPSALNLVVNMRGLKKHHVDGLQWVFFGGETMPVKALKQWIAEYPETKFVNIYGPTEVTDTFMSYTVNRELQDQEAVPIGEPRDNHEIIILNEKNELAGADEVGELCVRGAGIALGYYNNPEQTAKTFVQNPIQSGYPEVVYRSGDLVKYNEYGELVYVARKDFQIKHMGHRIELGEIETAMVSIQGIESGCCMYDAERDKIIAYYVGNIEEIEVYHKIKEMLPDYMVPNIRVRLQEMPKNLNGKIDRERLKEIGGKQE